MDKLTIFEQLKIKIIHIAEGLQDKETKLKILCRLLKNNLPGYDWVGFYFVNPENEKELILGPFEGEPTEHLKIPFGRGICGQAAESKKAFIVYDVNNESNYLACSPYVKSEIVLPIFRKGTLVGELDIDSHGAGAFDDSDREFLEMVCQIIAPII